MRTQPLLFIIAALALLPLAHAQLQLDSIQFDPVIIASGDDVDIIVQFHDETLSMTDTRIGNPDYRFKVMLLPDDTLTEQYVRITDAQGDEQQGIITRGGIYNRKFHVKVQDDAPAGAYQFKLEGQWYKDTVAQEAQQYVRFTMPVKKVGISLSVANILSSPERIRSGDKNILLTATLANTGEKTAKNVRIALDHPAGMSAAYTNNNNLNVGSIESMQQRDVQFYIDTERTTKEGVYDLSYTLTYQDTDNNNYQTLGSIPIVIKKKPNIIITKSEGEGTAGSDISLRIDVQNIGEETADAVDVRILKQSSQPFDMDVRSDYIGQLEPGANGTAIFTISANAQAEIKEHKLTVIIRAKGDSEEGDDNIYTFTDAATIRISGKAPNRYPLYAGIFLGIVIITATILALAKRKERQKRK